MQRWGAELLGPMQALRVQALALTNMEVDNRRCVKESNLPRDHAIHFHVSTSECK